MASPKLTARSLIAPLMALLFAAPAHCADDNWQFAFSVYGWLPNINIEDSNGRMSGMSRSDIVENLDPSFLSSVIAGRGRFYIGVDMIYLALSSKSDDVITTGLSLRKTEISSVLMNPFIGYRVYDGERHYINMDVGARYFWQDLDLTFRTPVGNPSGSVSESVWDAVVGLNGRLALTDKWYFRYFGTIGTGQSDLVWSYAGTLGYEFQRFDAEAGWREMHYEFDSDSDFKRIDFPGPYVGLTLRF
jgi:hypothetical protein